MNVIKKSKVKQFDGPASHEAPIRGAQVGNHRTRPTHNRKLLM